MDWREMFSTFIFVLFFSLFLTSEWATGARESTKWEKSRVHSDNPRYSVISEGRIERRWDITFIKRTAESEKSWKVKQRVISQKTAKLSELLKPEEINGEEEEDKEEDDDNDDDDDVEVEDEEETERDLCIDGSEGTKKGEFLWIERREAKNIIQSWTEVMQEASI